VKRLALDTSSLACTVALSDDAVIYERHEERAREHTRLLMPMIRSVLDEAQLSITDVDAIVLGNGPGSFIGMRIAASVAQGLAFGTGIRIIPVSSLAAIAAEVMYRSDATVVAVTQDAHLQEVYLGIYERGADDLPRPICEERLQAEGVIDELSRGDRRSTLAAGQGWQSYPGLFARNKAWLAQQSPVRYPRARYLLGLSDLSAAIAAADIQPAYLRHKVADKPGPSAP
jgi:tRNA threonylcarbamoyladenosine biosynthesis protein TsaB